MITFKTLARITVAMTASALWVCTSIAAGPLTPGELPMYGGLDRQADPILKGADEALIEGTTREFGSPTAASKQFTDQGFRYYFADDLAQAMRRFNQGWLLDPGNPDVFYGFMAVLSDRGEFCDSRVMVEKAFELGLEKSPETLADAGSVHAMCAALGVSLTDELKTAYAKRASEYYTEALKLDPGSPYVYGSWARTSYWVGDYAAAWRYVKLERQHGGTPDKRLLKKLKSKMREPKS